ncbi:hypothetical protein VT84_19965 [Gemmata sp. SH-PL17]|uniref:hypothetical protein n=1 Tax=Gemmata sp. SH-PL17 TaxID=1630693 RepID=UPI00078E51BF|nr:hypothetical protein [Gemmata sp. SH-PL17]AMV26686.1 hypothetical protein VT84_19965 [Gemmata sp. SH-PL17]
MSTQPVSVYTAVREILVADGTLSTDEIVTRAKARGVTKPDAAIRKVVNNTKSELKLRSKKNKKAGRKLIQPLFPSPYTVAREVLAADPELPSAVVLSQLKARGVSRSDSEILEAIRKTRMIARHKARAVPAAARATTASASEGSGEETVFSGLALANKTAHLCGGVAKAREIAEAIRSCGGIDTFLKRLELIAEILSSDTDL